jgi:hypothetical protein
VAFLIIDFSHEKLDHLFNGIGINLIGIKINHGFKTLHPGREYYSIAIGIKKPNITTNNRVHSVHYCLIVRYNVKAN